MKILIVDDQAINLRLLRAQLESEEHVVLEAADGIEALEILGQDPIDLVISDILMPRMDGYVLLTEIRNSSKFSLLPFVVYTATYTSPSDEKLSLELGADLYLRKPASLADLIKAIKTVTSDQQRFVRQTHATVDVTVMKEYNQALVNKLEQKLGELEASNQKLLESEDRLLLGYDATIEGWSRALDLRDKETEGHSQRVTGLAYSLAKNMGLEKDDLVNIRRGALLHDIGKMGVPDTILFNPGQLTDEEWLVMKMHPVYAYDMLFPILYLREALKIPYSHHEKWDGSGYPQGLSAEAIPFAARIFAVADVYDALISDRPYRKAWSQEKALDYIKEQAGIHFDPKVVAVFLETVPDAALLIDKVSLPIA